MTGITREFSEAFPYMKVKKENIAIERYIINDEWLVEIEETEDSFDAWICDTDGESKMHMFRVDKYGYRKDLFIRYVGATLNRYIDLYMQETYDKKLWHSILNRIAEERDGE